MPPFTASTRRGSLRRHSDDGIPASPSYWLKSVVDSTVGMHALTLASALSCLKARLAPWESSKWGRTDARRAASMLPMWSITPAINSDVSRELTRGGRPACFQCAALHLRSTAM